MIKKFILTLKILWVSAYGLLMGFLAWNDISGGPTDAHVAVGWGVLVLTFPIGYVITILHGGLFLLVQDLAFFQLTPIAMAVGITIGAITFMAGYWQWFILPGWICKKIRGKNSSSSP